jgi:predicted dehydrogenase
MLAEVSPDFALALGRHDTQAGIATHLLESGIPFIMEKPMSYNAHQLRKVVETAESTGTFAAVSLSSRYLPVMQKALKLIQENNYGPMTHFYQRLNRPTSARYPAWQSDWMLESKIANGGCLRNLGSHGLDAFVLLTGEGEDVEVTGAQLSWSTHGLAIEDYASVLVKSGNGVLGTIEVGNGFPRDGTDGEWKVAFRNAILTFKDNILRINTADGEEVLSPEPPGDLSAISARVMRDTLDAMVRGDEPPIGIHDCYNAVRLIDQAYIAAGNPYGTAAL